MHLGLSRRGGSTHPWTKAPRKPRLGRLSRYELSIKHLFEGVPADPQKTQICMAAKDGLSEDRKSFSCVNMLDSMGSRPMSPSDTLFFSHQTGRPLSASTVCGGNINNDFCVALVPVF